MNRHRTAVPAAHGHLGRSLAGRLLAALLFTALLTGPRPAQAGGFLESLDVTGHPASPKAGELVARLQRIRWDARCIPVAYRINNSQDPIPNPLGPAFLSVADASMVIDQAFATWNHVPTSYIDLRLVGTTPNPGPAGFDFVNEVSFRRPSGFGAIAVSPSITLIEDAELADGDDIDGDGDADVSAAIATCADVDGDGDIEFPAGSYPAGTILDNDILFNTDGFRFTSELAAVDTNRFSVDMLAIAVHEAGHSHGLSHVLDDQLSASDGTATTMFPFIDTSDPASELAQRSLAEDDRAYSSFYYPEGSASSGPAALQPGDLPFRLLYGTIRGSVTQGSLGGPLAGASIRAENLFDGRLAAAGFSGHTQLSWNPVTGELDPISPSFSILDGDYEIPLPLGLYQLRIEAVDGNPVGADSISFNALIGDFFGQQSFLEEAYNGPLERAAETSPGQATPVLVIPGLTSGGKDFITNRQFTLGSDGPFDSVGFTGAPPGTYYALRLPADFVRAVLGSGRTLVQAVEYFTFVFDASVVPVFSEALLTTGTATGTTAEVDLGHPLRRTTGFVAQERDFSPFYLSQPQSLAQEILRSLAHRPGADLFLVLRLPTTSPYPGVSGLPPTIGLSEQEPILGFSYISTDGVTFNQRPDLDFLFRLVVTQP